MGQSESGSREPASGVLAIPLESIQSDYPIETGLFSYPQRYFLLNSAPPQPHPQEPQILLEFTADFAEEVSLQLRAYPYLSDALRSETNGLEITGVFLDELNISKILYSVDQREEGEGEWSGRRVSLFIRNFHGFNEDYLNIAYEINTYLAVAALNSPYLHAIRRHFVVLPEPEVIDFYSHVAVLEPVACTLSLIIRQRRKEGNPWTFAQFYGLFLNLVEGLSALHGSGLNHNDIRPSNVYFSAEKDCFLLGSFSNVTKRAGDKLRKNIKESNHYKDLYSNRKITRMSSLQLASLDLAKTDVYSLGMTLLSAFYLCEPIDRKKCAPHNRALKEAFPYLAVIKEMICKIDQRKSIFEIKTLLQAIYPPCPPTPLHPVYSPPVSASRKRESYIGQGYQCLGMIGRWKDKLKQIFMQEQSIQSSFENARKFQQLAITSKIEGRNEKSMSEYAQAAQIYTNLGELQFQEGSFARAIDFFRRAFDNYEKVEQKEEQESYLRLVVKMAECKITSGHELVSEEELADLERDIESIKGSDAKLFWEYTQSLLNIYDYYEEYGKVREVLARKEASIEGIKTKINILILKRRIIRNNLKLATAAPSAPHTHVLIETVALIREVFENYEYYLLEHPLEKLKMEFLLAKSQFLLIPTPDNLSSLSLLSSKLDERLLLTSKDRQGNPNPNPESNYTEFYIEILTELGDVHFTHFRNYNEALLHYSKAFDRGKDFFGDIYNRHCAELLERIGRVNKSVDRFKTYLECHELAGKIYKNIYGAHHKALLRMGKRAKDELEETINQTLSNSRQLEEAATSR